MAYFADTNLALGYSVVHDKWHKKSKKFIENHENIYWSNLVQAEYENKLNDIENQSEFFLKRVKLTLKNTLKSLLIIMLLKNISLEKQECAI